MANIQDTEFASAPGVSAVITAPVQVVNSADEVQLIYAVLPPGIMTVGSTFRAIAHGIWSTDNPAPSLTFRVRIGPVTLTGNIVTTVAPTPRNGEVNRPFMIQFLITVRTVGAAGTIIGNGLSTEECSAVCSGVVKGSGTTVAAAVNTTIQNILELTVQWGAADNANDISIENAEITTKRI